MANNIFRRRPYRVECTGSLLTSEVKQRRARSVLGWGTAWEDLRVLSAFSHHALPRRWAPGAQSDDLRGSACLSNFFSPPLGGEKRTIS